MFPSPSLSANFDIKTSDIINCSSDDISNVSRVGAGDTDVKVSNCD